MKEIVFGIIGAGMITGDHLESLSGINGTYVKWISDISIERADLLANKFNVPHTATERAKIYEDPEVDAIIVATPPYTHHEISTDAIRSGKHVLIEKPMGFSRDEVNSIVSTADDHPDQVVLEASARHARLTPKYRRVKEIIGSGLLGDIYYVHHNAVYRQGRPGIEYHPQAKWFLDRSKAFGGPLFDWGVYDMSFHLGVLGDCHELNSVRSYAYSGLDEKDPGTDVFDVEEHGFALMEFSGGLKYFWERAAHANMEAPDETRICGTRGGIKLSYLTWESPEIHIYSLQKGGKAEAINEVAEVDYSDHGGDGLELIRHFCAVLRGEEQAVLPLKTAAKHMDILFSVYDSVAANY